LNNLLSLISLRYSSSSTSAISINALSRTSWRLFILWFNLLKRRSYLNEIKSVRRRSIIWRNAWLRLWYFVILIRLMRQFLKLIHSTTSTMKFYLSMMMRKHCILLSSIARICLSLNATTKYMIRNCWSSFKHLSINDLSWSWLIFLSKSSLIIKHLRHWWKIRSLADNRCAEYKSSLTSILKYCIDLINRTSRSMH